MEKDVIDIMILRVNKYEKKDKCMFDYVTPDDETTYSKGMMLLQQWFTGNESKKFFNDFNINHIAMPLKAHFEYRKTFKGQARMVLTDIFNEKGEVLYQF